MLTDTNHEEVAAFAAGAEAQLTSGSRSVPVCGPGKLHLINGLGGATATTFRYWQSYAYSINEIGSGYFRNFTGVVSVNVATIAALS